MPGVVVIGENGQVARCLGALGGAEFKCFGRSSIDPKKPEMVEALIDAKQPRLVLNAAAYTQVDLAEKEQELAFALNCELPRQIAISCSRHQVPFVHISTDYVFDGNKVGAYVEADEPNPLGAYGASKLAGDLAVQEAADVPFSILRASWVFSDIGETFPRKIIRRAREHGSLRVVDDQRGCPTPAADLARTMIEIGQRLVDGDGRAHGLFNYCGDLAMSWFDFALRLVRDAKEHGLGPCTVVPMGTGELQLAAKRPANSVLDCARLRAQCGIEPAPVERAIAEAAANLMRE